MKITRKNIRQCGATLFTLFLIVAGLKCASRILRNNESNFKYDPFFKNETDYDVLFYGSSHVINGVFPMQLWHDWGITSYNLSMHDSHIVNSYELLKLSLKYKKPKVAVIDVFVSDKKKNLTKISYLHKSFDAFPVTVSKILALKEGTKEREDMNIKELFIPFSLYHSRWNENNIRFSSLFDKTRNREMGAESRINVAVPNKVSRIDKDERLPEDSLPWLEKFIVHCQKNDIQPVLVFIPYPLNIQQQKVNHTVPLVAQKYGVPFIDLFEENILNLETDCYDNGSHLNPSGARKVTEAIGRFLSEELKIKDRRAESAYAEKWNYWYEDYKNLLVQNLKRQGNLKNTLMLLNNSNFTAEISVSDRYEFDAVESQLLAQISAVSSVNTKTFSENGNCDVIIVVKDVSNGTVVHKIVFNKDSSGTLKKFDGKKK